jgi:hypothetical protein
MLIRDARCRHPDLRALGAVKIVDRRSFVDTAAARGTRRRRPDSDKHGAKGVGATHISPRATAGFTMPLAAAAADHGEHPRPDWGADPSA